MAKTESVVLSLKNKCSPAIINIAEKIGIAENKAEKLNITLIQQAKITENMFKAMQNIVLIRDNTNKPTLKITKAGDNIKKISRKIDTERKQYQKKNYTKSQNGIGFDILKTNRKIPAAECFLKNIQKPAEKTVIGQKFLKKSSCDIKPVLNQFLKGSSETSGTMAGAQLIPFVQNPAENFLKSPLNIKTVQTSLIKGFFSTINNHFNVIKGEIGSTARFTGIVLNYKNTFNSAEISFNIKQKEAAGDSTNSLKPLCYRFERAFSKSKMPLVEKYKPQIVYLPQRANISPADKTRDILNNSSNVTVNLNVAGNILGNREFFDEMMNLMAAEIKKMLIA